MELKSIIKNSKNVIAASLLWSSLSLNASAAFMPYGGAALGFNEIGARQYETIFFQYLVQGEIDKAINLVESGFVDLRNLHKIPGNTIVMAVLEELKYGKNPKRGELCRFLEYILEKYPDLSNLANDKGQTPLGLAFSLNPDVVKILLNSPSILFPERCVRDFVDMIIRSGQLDLLGMALGSGLGEEVTISAVEYTNTRLLDFASGGNSGYRVYVKNCLDLFVALTKQLAPPESATFVFPKWTAPTSLRRAAPALDEIETRRRDLLFLQYLKEGKTDEANSLISTGQVDESKRNVLSFLGYLKEGKTDEAKFLVEASQIDPDDPYNFPDGNTIPMVILGVIKPSKEPERSKLYEFLEHILGKYSSLSNRANNKGQTPLELAFQMTPDVVRILLNSPSISFSGKHVKLLVDMVGRSGRLDLVWGALKRGLDEEIMIIQAMENISARLYVYFDSIFNGNLTYCVYARNYLGLSTILINHLKSEINTKSERALIDELSSYDAGAPDHLVQKEKILKLLGEIKNINHQNELGCTILMGGVIALDLDIVMAILVKHPDLSLENSEGETALDIAMKNGYMPIAEAIIAAMN
jgi:ankyrin repeat protein